MAHLSIDTHKNTVTLRSQALGEVLLSRHFSRRWEAYLLALLLQQAQLKASLGMSVLTNALSQRGQAKALNRAQIQRLFQGVQSFLDAISHLGLFINTPPRKATVGPWTLHLPEGIEFCVDDVLQLPVSHPPRCSANPMDMDQLHQILSTLLVADALASEGSFGSAIDVLTELNQATLSAEGQGLFMLRLSAWHKRLGAFSNARAYAQAALQLKVDADNGLRPYAAFMLQRIDYDENPTAHAENLWQISATPPDANALTPAPNVDWRTLAEWHNLRALLARRRLHTSAADAAIKLHQQALEHYQAALYMAAWGKDWDRLQAYVANLVYHLQSMMDKPQPLAVQTSTVVIWHRLTMAYESKLQAGRDSAWEYIFFGKFWLDNCTAIALTPASDPLAHSLDNTNPEHETFYQRALARLRGCGDDRQVAIAHSLYLRFAEQHMSGQASELVTEEQGLQLQALLSKQQNKSLLTGLVAEGYDQHWPESLRLKLRLQPQKRKG